MSSQDGPLVGIDLGTNFSALSIMNEAGRPEIVTNGDGHKLTHSAVFVRDDGVIEVGESAHDDHRLYPDRVETAFKRRMGDPLWRGPKADPQYSAVDFSTFVLKKLKQDAEKRLGEISQAVIAVPAYFDDACRKATIQAANQAGLEVTRIINEPTAAAVAYLNAGGKPGTILVFDLGGGTFDVTVARILDSEQMSAQVMASDGDDHLGGIDFDRALADHVDTEFQRANRGLSCGGTKNGRPDPGKALSLEQDCCALKHKLSKRDSADIPCTSGAIASNITVTREQFESLIGDYLAKMLDTTRRVVDEAGLKPSDIDRALLVGGSTRIPAVRRLVQDFIAKPPEETVHPDEAVALGAAVVAANPTGKALPPGDDTGAVQVSDNIEQDIGTTVYDVRQKRSINDVLIKKGTKIPAEATRRYYTGSKNQVAIECDVTSCRGETHPDKVKKLHTRMLKVPSGRKDGCPIDVVYRIDQNGLATFQFVDVESGEEQKFIENMNLAATGGGSAPSKGDRDRFDDLLIQ